MSEARMDAAKIPRAVAAEAAVWVTRLHGPDRSPQLEHEFREWLKKDPANSAAFERSTAVWDSVEGISVTVAYGARKAAPRRDYRAAIGTAVLASLAALMLGWIAFFQDPTYETGQGEQRSITLMDGSRVLLNTHTRVTPRFSEGGERLVELESGEALFEVAKDPNRKFVVTAGGKRITALGTTFAVRHYGGDVAVTLIEGRVAVTSAASAPSATSPLNAVLVSGQRLRAKPAAEPQIDTPVVEQVVAWRRGEVLFDETPLSEAIAEMNRYGLARLVLEGEGTNDLKVSGVFRIGDSEAFAHAVSSVHGLTVARTSERIVLAAKRS
jgi:transmembrane sensor